MKVMLVACLFACFAFSSVQSASFYYRNGRDVVIPIENEVIRDEIVSELRKEAVEVAAEEVNPIVEQIVREEVLVPVDALRLVEPVVEAQEPAAIVNTEVIVSALRSVAPAVDVVPEVIAAVTNVADESVAEKNAIPAIRNPEAIAAVSNVADEIFFEKEVVPTIRVAAILEDAVIPAQVAEEVAEKEVLPSVEDIPVKVVVLNDESVPAVIVASDDAFERQTGGATAPARPTLIQAAQTTLTNLLNNNPIANAFQAIRNPQSDTVPPVVANVINNSADEKPDSVAPAAPVAPTSRPSLIQQFQNNVQQFQSQVQNTIQGITGGTSSNSGENRPGFIAQIQQTINQAINRPLAIFRPNQQDAVTEQKVSVNPVVTPPIADAIVPIVTEKVELVDDKIDASKKSE